MTTLGIISLITWLIFGPSGEWLNRNLVQVFEKPTFYEANLSFNERLAQIPEVKQYLGDRGTNFSEKQAFVLGKILVTEGIKRVDDHVIHRLLSVKRGILENADPITCGAIAIGKADTLKQRIIMERLDPTTVETLFDILIESILAQIKGNPRKGVSKSQLLESQKYFWKELPRNDVNLFQKALQDSTKIPLTDICRIARDSYEKIENMNEPHRTILSRQLVKAL